MSINIKTMQALELVKKLTFTYGVEFIPKPKENFEETWKRTEELSTRK
jgi:hypothetical protein